MCTRRTLFRIVTAGIVLLATAAGLAGTAQGLPREQQAGPPDITVPYSGRLSGEDGQPVADGNYSFTFALYRAESAGEPLWSEVQEGVAVSQGEFFTPLGRANHIPAALLGGGDLWLAVGVRGSGESGFTALSPRQRLSAVAEAPAAPQAAAPCAHTHWGETWSGSGAGLALNSNNATPLWAYGGAGNTGIVGISTFGAVPTPPPSVIGMYGYGDQVGVYGSAGAYAFAGVYGEAAWPAWGLYADGDIGASGSKSAVVPTRDYGWRRLYSMESPDVLFEDVGTAELWEGQAKVAFDPIFAQTVNLEEDYHVFLTALSKEPVLLYVSAKSRTGFTVRGVTLDGKPAGCSFDYRIVAKRLGYEGVRLEPVDGGGVRK